jgi:hypothetical protein
MPANIAPVKAHEVLHSIYNIADALGKFPHGGTVNPLQLLVVRCRELRQPS